MREWSAMTPRWVAGTSVDWERVYEDHAGQLAGYLAKLVGDREVACELTQEAFLRALKSGGSLREPAAARAWLYRVGTNLASNHRRRRALLRFLPFSGDEPGSSEAFDPEAEQVRSALRADTRRRAPVRLVRRVRTNETM